jgi:MFS family permease
MMFERFLRKNESLQLKEYRSYLKARFLLIFSLNWQTAVVAYMIYELTRYSKEGPELYLGLMGLAEVIPAVGGSLLSGPFVDRREKRDLVMACILIYTVLSLLFVAVAFPGIQARLSFKGTLAVLYTGIFIGGLARAFWSPSAFSLVGLLVPRAQLPNATTWSSMAWQAGSVLGPLAGGLLMAPLGYEVSFLTVTFLLLLAAMAISPIPKQAVHTPAQKEPVLKSVGEGLRFVFKNQLLLSALSLDLFAVLFGGATALLPVYANEILHAGPQGYGWLKAAAGIGTITTLWLLTWKPLKTHPGWKLLLAVAGFGICTIVFGLSTNYWLSLVALVALGMFDGVSVVLRGLILQLKTPQQMRGRVAAVNTMFVSSSNEIGSLESGLTARYFGTVPAVVAGGILTILVAGIVGLTAPRLRTFDIDQETAED